MLLVYGSPSVVHQERHQNSYEGDLLKTYIKFFPISSTAQVDRLKLTKRGKALIIGNYYAIKNLTVYALWPSILLIYPFLHDACASTPRFGNSKEYTLK